MSAASGDVVKEAPPSPAWQDVTQLFSAAAKELKVGQLVHVQDFNLFDSMSALELMDPKMDGGLLLHGAAPLSVRERVQRNAVPLTFTSARDVLATIDELFRVEAAWLDGHPMPQTLLTCVYLHRDAITALLTQLLPASDDENPDPLETRLLVRLDTLGGAPGETLLLVMATMAVFTLRACAHVREVVVRADIYEEEDFSPSSVGHLDTSIFDAWTKPALEMLLLYAIDRMQTLLAQERTAAAAKGSAKKASKKKGAKSKETKSIPHDSDEHSVAPVKLEGLDANVKISALLSEALLRRLQFRKVLHDVYSELGLAEELADLELAQASFTSARELLKELASEALEFDAECFSGKPFGFDKSLSRLFMTGSPPRDVKLPITEGAIQIYDKLISDMLVACSPGDWKTMEDVRVFLADFSRGKPNIVARSFVLLLLYCEKKIYGRHGFMDWLTEEMVMNGVPSVLLSTQEGVQYSSRAIETVYESLKLYLHNRSRQRARIEYLLEEWAVLQVEAVAVDERFMAEMQIPKASYPRYFTAWTLEQVSLLMIQYVVLGIELDLYAPNEFSAIYWYLDYLCGARLQNLTFTWGFLERMKELMKDHPRRGTSSKPTNSDDSESEPTKGTKAKKPDPAKTRFEREISYTETMRSMMRAYFQIFAALERESLVSVAPPAYGSRLIRFQHRFAAFQSLHFPAPLTYDDFLKNSDFSRYEVELIYKSAEECFKTTRVHSEEVKALSREEVQLTGTAIHKEEVQTVCQVAVANLVELARRDQAHAQARNGRGRGSKSTHSSPGSTIEFDFSKHPHFPVLSFGEVTDSTRR